MFFDEDVAESYEAYFGLLFLNPRFTPVSLGVCFCHCSIEVGKRCPKSHHTYLPSDFLCHSSTKPAQDKQPRRMQAIIKCSLYQSLCMFSKAFSRSCPLFWEPPQELKLFDGSNCFEGFFKNIFQNCHDVSIAARKPDVTSAQSALLLTFLSFYDTFCAEHLLSGCLVFLPLPAPLFPLAR